MKVIYPENPSIIAYDTTRTPIEFNSDGLDSETSNLDGLKFKVPVFSLESSEDVKYVLMKDVANLWNYPSSYQLMGKLLKSSKLTKLDFHKSQHLNQQLLDNQLIEDVKFNYFYIELSKLYGAILNKEILLETSDGGDMDLDIPNDSTVDDKITLTQVFPAYGFVNSTMELKHSTFNSLTNLTKYNYYKATGTLPRFFRTKLFAQEAETFYNLNDYSKLEFDNDEILLKNLKKRKPLGKPKKNHTNIDPNSLDLHESVIPGQGYIQEFNINHLCKIPNYYITSQQQQQQYQQFQQQQHQQQLINQQQLQNISGLGKKTEGGVKISRNIQQLVFNNNDFDSNFNVGRYFYSKTYRGPGSGNYKDASLVNRINKIPMSATNSVTKKHIKDSYKSRLGLHLKGLIPNKFNKAYVDDVLSKQRNHVEDYNNLEMLHNTLEFNLLVNTYRDISYDTWINYYKFKFMDFEKMVNQKADNDSFLLSRFNLPTDYPQINRQLPLSFRDEIKNPLYYNLKLPDNTRPDLLTNIDIIKLPNSNEVAWDNLKKYQDN